MDAVTVTSLSSSVTPFNTAHNNWSLNTNNPAASMGNNIATADWATVSSDPTLTDRLISSELIATNWLALDTSGPLGRAITIIIGAIAELERSLIIERVRAGMRRARLEGRHIGRQPLVLDEAGIIGDRARGLSLREIAKTHRISTATVRRVLTAQRPALACAGD